MPFLDNYKLQTKKGLEYLDFIKIAYLIKHLPKDSAAKLRRSQELDQLIAGLQHMRALDKKSVVEQIQRSMPLGPLPQADKNFANWLAGFTDGDGGFTVSVSPNKTSRLGLKVHAAYFVCQHNVDQPLLEQIKNRLPFGKGCGFRTSKPPASLEYVVSGKIALAKRCAQAPTYSIVLKKHPLFENTSIRQIQACYSCVDGPSCCYAHKCGNTHSGTSPRNVGSRHHSSNMAK